MPGAREDRYLGLVFLQQAMRKVTGATRTALLALSFAVPINSQALAELSQPRSYGHRAWDNCRIASSAHAGQCAYTLISAGGNTTNIHFLLGATKPQGLIFVFWGEIPELATKEEFFVVVEEFKLTRLNQVGGRCINSELEIVCASGDGRFSAKASMTKP